MNKTICWFIGFLFHFSFMYSQNQTNTSNDSSAIKKEYINSTFKTTRIVIGPSIESPAPGDLLFTVSHHFGKISEGAYEFFGLTTSTIRLGLDLGVTKKLSAGIGLSTFQKNTDACVKYKILSQSAGSHRIPVTVTYFGEADVTMLKWDHTDIKYNFSSRISYANMILIARKMNKNLSIQLSPSFIHYNFIISPVVQNDIFAIGAGGRYKISKHTSVNIEYYYLLSKSTAQYFNNSFSAGFDIETGGHVFQLFLTNSYPLFNRGFITETNGKWTKGDISFGFNINRIFTL
jgi:hypothetical protein